MDKLATPYVASPCPKVGNCLEVRDANGDVIMTGYAPTMQAITQTINQADRMRSKLIAIQAMVTPEEVDSFNEIGLAELCLKIGRMCETALSE